MSYLGSHAIRSNYTGYDISPELVARASARFPEVDFEVAATSSVRESPTVRYIISSQAFNYRLSTKITSRW